MNVAIIDDEQDNRKQIGLLLKKFMKEQNMEVCIEEFSSGEQLLAQYQGDYDVLVLDVDMPGRNGIETAKAIREMDKEVLIMFITNVAQYAIMGYEVEAIDYIIKPVEYNAFFMKFQKVFRKYQQKKVRYIILEIPGNPKRISTSHVLYVEVLNHNISYHLENEVIILRGSMKEHEAELKNYYFSRVHKSYMVNMEHVKQIKSDHLIIEQEKIPIGRAYKEQFMQDYMRYLGG